MTTENTQLTELLELANRYPSPHNGQPIVLQQTDTTSFDIFFQKERGLQAAEVSFLFSYVTMGVFIQHLSRCAQALGYAFSYKLGLPPLEAIKGAGLVQFASCTFTPSTSQPDTALHQTLLFRQTSRKKYVQGLDDELAQRTIAIAASKHMQLIKMNRHDTHQAIWLNQRAVFDDMFDDAVRNELNHWLRYTKEEKEAKQDGLAYDCMELNGRAMKFIVEHY